MKKTLDKLGLNSNNSIVTGSGILQALKIRKSGDLDLMITEEIYNKFQNSGKYKLKKKSYGDVLSGENIDMRKDWILLGKLYNLDSLKEESTIINGIRYLTLDFLYRIKKSWIKENTARPKDIKDIELMEKYMKLT